MWSLAIAAAGAAPAVCETLGAPGAVGASVAVVVGAAVVGAAGVGAAGSGAAAVSGAVMTVGAADCSAAGGSASERGAALTLTHPSTPNIERMTLLAGTNKTMTLTSRGHPGGIPYHGRGLAREKCTT